MQKPMTKREAQALKYIRDYHILNGYMPTYQEIANAMGCTSRSWAHLLVKRLEDGGHLTRVVGKSRNIVLDKTRTKKVQSKHHS